MSSRRTTMSFRNHSEEEIEFLDAEELAAALQTLAEVATGVDDDEEEEEERDEHLRKGKGNKATKKRISKQGKLAFFRQKGLSVRNRKKTSPKNNTQEGDDEAGGTLMRKKASISRQQKERPNEVVLTVLPDSEAEKKKKTGRTSVAETTLDDTERTASDADVIKRRQSAKDVGERIFHKKIDRYLGEESFTKKYCNKGTISNLLSFIVMSIGIFLFEFTKRQSDDNDAELYAKILLSLGLFSFAGGLTNWLAIKMLFDKIPCFYGSGVILREFEVIKESIKSIVMELFFDKGFIEDYISERARDLVSKIDIKKFVLESLSHEKVGPIIERKIKANTRGKKPLQRLAKLVTVLKTDKKLVKLILPTVAKLAADVVPEVINNIDVAEFVDIDVVLEEIEKLVSEKLDLLSPELIKTLLERLIREHLGWLVVWGNVFGGLIGIISQLVGYGP